jgi:hypothetical protein
MGRRPEGEQALTGAELRIPVDRDHRFRLIVIIQSIRSGSFRS